MTPPVNKFYINGSKQYKGNLIAGKVPVDLNRAFRSIPQWPLMKADRVIR